MDILAFSEVVRCAIEPASTVCIVVILCVQTLYTSTVLAGYNGYIVPYYSMSYGFLRQVNQCQHRFARHEFM